MASTDALSALADDVARHVATGLVERFQHMTRRAERTLRQFAHDTMPLVERSALAHHEAGHGVAEYLLLGHFAYVTIALDHAPGASGHLLGVPVSFGELTPQTAAPHVQTYFAGPVAECRHTGKSLAQLTGSANNLMTAEAIARCVGIPEAGVLDYLAEQLAATRALLSVPANDFAVQVVAAALLREGSLDYAMVRGLITAAQAGCP